MSSEVFENREEDLTTLLNDIRGKIERQFVQSTGETRKRIIRDVERDLEECNLLIQEMEGEARKAPPTFRLDMVSKVRNYRRDVDQMTRNIQSNSDFDNHRMDGFFNEDDFASAEESKRARLLQGTQHLNRTSESLARTHRVAAETDQIGTDIIDELGQQRESLLRTHDRLHSTDANLSKSRIILTTMGKRLVTNKVILVVVILLELGILGGVIYWKFFT